MTEKHANNNVRWPVITSQSFWVPIIDAIPEGNTEVGDSEEEEAHDNSEEAAQSRSTFKYKSSHPEELIIGSKDTPIRTSSAFRNESFDKTNLSNWAYLYWWSVDRWWMDCSHARITKSLPKIWYLGFSFQNPLL